MQRLLLAIIFLVVMPLHAAELPTVAEIDKAVAAIADYQTTKSRGPVAEVERIAAVTRGQTELRNRLEDKLAGLLKAQCTDDCRECILDLLATIGSDRSVEAVDRLLESGRWTHPACTVLLNNPSPKAGEALRSGARGIKGGDALACVLGAIGDRRDVAATDMLIEFSRYQEEGPAAAAIVALGKVATDPALARLADLRKNSPPELRASALDASLIAASRVSAKNPQQAIAIYRECLEVKLPRHVRRGALVGMIQASGAEAVPLIISTLSGNDPDFQATAISQVRLLKGEEITRRFADELPRLSPALQKLLVEALEDRADPAARPAVIALVSSTDADVRLAAIKALQSLGDAGSVAVLARVVEKGSDAEVKAALQALRRIKGDTVEPAIIAAMTAGEPPVRAQLIAILNERGATAAVPQVLKQIDSTDVVVRRSALRMIAQWGSADDLPGVLKSLTADIAAASRGEAETTAIALARKQADEVSRARPVIASLAATSAPAARSSLLRVLRGVGTAAAYDAVLAATKDADATVQDSATRALCDWPDARAIPSLMDLCKTTQNPTHKVLAIRGVLRLLSLNAGRPADATVAAYREVMSLAKRADEKKQVLAGLTALPHPAALEMAIQAGADPAVASEAALASISVARAIAGLDRQIVSAAMKKLADTSTDEKIKAQAREVLALADKFGDFITGWQICGPYFRDGISGQGLFGTKMGPESDDTPKPVWRLVSAGTDPALPTIVDLLAAFGGENRVAYARTWVIVDEAQDARLELGSDDGVMAWLNGKVIHSNNTGRGCVPGSDKVNIHLEKGANELQLKIVQWVGPWSFCAKIVKPDGTALPGLKTDCRMK